MSPVLGYARTDRVDRSRGPHRSSPNRVDSSRSRSPQSQSSQGSNSSGNSGSHQTSRFAASSAGASLLNRFTGWSRGGNGNASGSLSNGTTSTSTSGAESNSEDQTASEPLQSPGPALANQSPHTNSNSNSTTNSHDQHAETTPASHSTSAGSSNDGVVPINIDDYCLGVPRKIGQSHAGGVELFMSVQEKAVFLPTVKRQHRNRHHHHHTNHRRHQNNGHDGGSSYDTDDYTARGNGDDNSDDHAGPGRHGQSVFDEYEPPESDHDMDDADHDADDNDAYIDNDENDADPSMLRSISNNSIGNSLGNSIGNNSLGNVSSHSTGEGSPSQGNSSQGGSSQGNHNQGNSSQENPSQGSPNQVNPNQGSANQVNPSPESPNQGSASTPGTPGRSTRSSAESATRSPHRNSTRDVDYGEEESSGSAETPSFSGPQRTLDLHSGGMNDDVNAHNSPCSTLRGSVLLKLSKPTKIKEIGVDFYCLSRTLWNLLSQSSVLADSTLPNNAQVEDTAYLGIHHWDFVPLEQFGSAQSQYDKSMASQSATLIGQDLYGADVAILKDQPDVLQQRKFSRVYNSQACRVRGQSSHLVPVFGPLKARPRKLKPNTVHSDGVLFPAGSYVYNFTLLVDAKTPGSVHVPNGQVKFVMAARVVRAGAFSMNVNGHMEVDVVRAPPDATSDGAVFGPMNDAVLLSRVWNDRFVYSVNIDRRNMTLDVPTRMTLSLLPLSDPDVRLHQVQVFVMETVTYVYSLDPSIRYVDPDLKLLLFQKDAPGPKHSGNLLRSTDSTTITADLTLVSMHNRSPHAVARQPFQRGRFGEMRFIEPDVKGPYISVKHRLMLVMRVSRSSDVDDTRCHYEVKIDTPICVQSRHCVAANIRLPEYSAPGAAYIPLSDSQYISSDFINDTEASPREHHNPGESPPSFDDAMNHELLGRSGVDSANQRGTKADFRSV